MAAAPSSAALAPLQTPLTHDFPATASLSRNDIDTLLAGWNPTRADAAWYRTDGQPSNASSSRNVAPIGEEAFEAFIEQLPQVKALRQESQRLLRLSEEKAARNVTVQPNLERLRNETQELFDRAKSLERRWVTLERDTNEEYRRFTPGTLLFNLTQSASKLHDESESLASAFVEGLPLEVAVRLTGMLHSVICVANTCLHPSAHHSHPHVLSPAV
jgi:hypothetical protein